MAIQNLRSSSAHKRPIPTVLSAGQIAINTNQASPGLFFKDSNGDLVKTGPVHIGTSAPNSSPATTAADALVSGTVYQILTLGNTDFTAVGASANTVGVVFTATGAGTGTGTVSGQQGNEKGELWLDTTSGYVLKTYDGTAWRTGTVTSSMIVDGTIVNADVNASAAIAGTKVSPNFGSQNILTTGTSTIGESSTLTNPYVKILQNDRVLDAYQESTSGSLFVGASKNADGTISNKFEVLSTGAASFSSQVSTTDRFDSNRTSGTDNVFNGRLNNSLTTTITANGSASFAATNTEIAATGQLTIKKTAPFTDPSFRILDRNNSNANGVLMYGDGTATFAGRVDTGSSTLDNAAFVGAARHATKGVIQAYHYNNGSVWVAGGADGVTKSEITAAGAATFAGDVAFGTGAADSRITLGSHGTAGTNDSVHVRADSANLLFMSGSGGITKFEQNGTARFTITADGSAEFASQVSTSDRFDSNRTSGTDNVFNGRLNGSVTTTITANGSATFGSFNTSSTTTHGATIDQFANSHSGVRVQSTDAATTVGEFFAAYRGSNPVFQVTTGGTATFTGNVTSKATFLNELQSGYSAVGSAYKVFSGSSTFVNILNNGSATFAGAVSKGSGSFRIDHPLKPETHQLVHSFVEGPQADNIYRGKVELIDGTATINIDTVSGMTEGTFAALNREIQCFTTNETGWTAVKGSVTGNLLTIIAQDNACTDTISWLVIGERKDQHMYDTEWTDENGKVIVEPEKPTEEAE